MEEQIHAPTIGELPTTRQLNRATLIAAGVAAIILVTAVLPGEYGIDPTGAGRILGLTEMGEAKRAAALEANAPAAADEAAENGDLLLDDEPSGAPSQEGAQTGEVTLTLQPDEGTEVKATMNAGDEITYQLATTGPDIRVELHGEETGASSSDFTSYEKGTSAGQSGTFRAPFDGTHGWYWRNRTAAPVTVTVKARGTFAKFAQLES